MTTKKIKGRGRPRNFDIDQAIEIAVDLFHQRGYDDVGVAELSKSIGITAPSLYSAFGSKRSLFERALKRYVETRGGWLITALARKDTLENKMTHFFLSAAEVYSTDDERCGCLVMDATRNCSDEKAKALTAEFQKVTWNLICDRITTDAPELSKPQLSALTDYVMMILMGLSGRARDGLETGSLKETADIAAAGFVQRLHSYQQTGKTLC
ncbi:MAG: TetR/AcrR family transcriptional regulator [Cyanobacteria bacterium P01_C01_bin.69]|mgnify:CR=1 FL=1